jgi:hypothetical protein
MVISQTVNGFDELLVQVIEKTIKYCLGERNAIIIINYLETQGYPLSEIPKKPEVFSEELRNLMGFGRRQIMGAAEVLEETILELFCKELRIKFETERPINFPYKVRKLRELYIAGDIRR